MTDNFNVIISGVVEASRKWNAKEFSNEGEFVSEITKLNGELTAELPLQKPAAEEEKKV